MKGWKDTVKHHRILRWSLLFSNWLFQGMIHSGNTEMIFKIFCEVVFFIIAFPLTIIFIENSFVQVITSLIISHTLNWIVNTNFNSLLIHRLYLKKLDKSSLFIYLSSLQEKLKTESWLEFAAIFGSISRGELKESSDLDVTFVRKSGIFNALKAVWFLFKERKIADFQGIPLEAYINETPDESARRFKKEDTAVVLTDSNSILSLYYENTISLNAARKLNKVG